METTARPNIGRSVLAAALGAIVMAAVAVGISANGNATTQETAQATTTAPESASDAADENIVETTVGPFSEDAAFEDDWIEYDQCMEEAGAYDLHGEEAFSTTTTFFEGEGDVQERPSEEPTDEEWAEIDRRWAEIEAECSLLLPESVQIENAAWAAHNECVEEILGESFYDELEWDDEAYREADLECRSVLPQDMQDELAAWDAHGECLSDILGPEFDGEEGTNVSISDIDRYESYILGEGDSTITVTKVDGEVTVSVDGDVLVQGPDYWAEQEERWTEAEETCASLMPESAYQG